MSSTQLIVLIISLSVATCFNQLRGHPQATRARKTKIIIANFILGQNETPSLLTVHTNKI